MSYITPDCAKLALKRMTSFHDELTELYHTHDMDLLRDLGRRNILMSRSQEKYFADELAKSYVGTHADGRTGQPDILIPALGRELECKLTSKHKSGAWSFQSDFETLSSKGELDYLYVLADEDFKGFAVLHFEGLTINDFRPLSNGARGKVAMYKHKGMKKCNVLVGNVVDLNQTNLSKLSRKLEDAENSSSKSKILKSIDYWENTPIKYQIQLENV